MNGDDTLVGLEANENVMQKAKGKISFTKNQNFLLSHQNKWGQDTIKLYKNGELEMSDRILYIRTEITGGSTIPLLDANIKNAVGITNLDGDKVPKNWNQNIDFVSLKYANVVSANADILKARFCEMEPSVASPAKGYWDAILLNSEIEVLQSGKVIIPRTQISVFRESRYFASGTPACGINLTAPKFLQEELELQVNIICPRGISLGAAVNEHHYVEIAFLGNATRKK